MNCCLKNIFSVPRVCLGGALFALPAALLAAFLAALLVLSANVAAAAALGDLQVESSPGEPLLARAPLFDIDGVELAELRISLAPAPVYERAAVARDELVDSIELRIEGASLVLSTQQPVFATDVELIFDIVWPGGRAFSQHRLLLQAATAVPGEPAPLAGQAAPPGAGQEASDIEPVRPIRIAAGDSLWRIARRVYGRGVRYTVIYAANRAQIEDPDLIFPGQVFSVPPPR